MANKFVNIKGLNKVFTKSENNYDFLNMLLSVIGIVDNNSILFITTDEIDEENYPDLYKDGEKYIFAKSTLYNGNNTVSSYDDTSIWNTIIENEHATSAALNNLNLQIAELTEEVEEKQDVLVSGTNIKTINGSSLLGSGNINISITADYRSDIYLNEDGNENLLTYNRLGELETIVGKVGEDDTVKNALVINNEQGMAYIETQSEDGMNHAYISTQVSDETANVEVQSSGGINLISYNNEISTNVTVEPNEVNISTTGIINLYGDRLLFNDEPVGDVDLSNLVTNEQFLPVSDAAYGAIPQGSLGTINGQSIENGHNVEVDMDLYVLSPDGLPEEGIQVNKIYVVPVVNERGETEFEEFVYINGIWDMIGSKHLDIDLSEYIKTIDADQRYLKLGSDGASASTHSISITHTGAFNNYGNNAQAFNAVRKVTGYRTGSGYPLNAASFGVKLDGTTAFSHKKYDTFDKETGEYTGAKNTAVLTFSGKSGLRYAKNTGTSSDVTEDMYRYIGVIDSPDEAQRCYSAAQTDALINTLIEKIESLESRVEVLENMLINQ